MTAESQTLTDRGGAFAEAVAAASGVNLASCLQCRKCTSGCPVAARADVKPHELVRLAQLGGQDEILGSRMLWECTTCETCVTRCPQKVDIPALIDALRQLSRAENKTAPGTTVPVFNDIFLRSVCSLGRTYEAGLMASYKLRTLRLLQDIDQVPMMLRKRKLALLPHKVSGGAERKQMFQRAKTAGRKGR